MLYLYLDESGDLGFDLSGSHPSRFFTIAVLVVRGHQNNQAIARAVRVTLRRKLKALRGVSSGELKGSSCGLEIKKFFYAKIAPLDFRVHAVTLDKSRIYGYMVEDKARIYNFIARMVLEKIDFADARVRVIITVDKSKSKSEIRSFNNCVIAQVKSRLDPKIPLEIFHSSSHKTLQLQAADMFAWGVFRKYEKGDVEWLECFGDKLGFEEIYRK